jgi:muramoyltetrapeptide carboxypeptidase
MSPTIKPKALQRKDAIGVVAPAGPVNRERMERALGRVRERGFRIKTYGDIYRSRGYLAGDDATRAGELMAAFADPETAAVWCARGGYGVSRIIDRLDFDVIRCFPKVFVGFSDITVLHVAIQQRAGLITFHGPNLQDGFGKTDDMPAANEAALWQAIAAEKCDIQAASSPAGSADKSAAWISLSTERAGYSFDLTGMEGVRLRPICGGVASGRLIGGNMAVLSGLMGTPFEIETAGRILFLEDVSERLYRIDRYLSQLRMAGKLEAAAGVLIGTFSYDPEDEPESESEVAALLEEYLKPLGVPVLAGFPAGHTQRNLTLPMGAHVQMDADRKIVTVCESPVE